MVQKDQYTSNLKKKKNNTGITFVRMCNTAGAAGLMPQYYCSTASTANFTFNMVS